MDKIAYNIAALLFSIASSLELVVSWDNVYYKDNAKSLSQCLVL
jgi:hypothetical protein